MGVLVQNFISRLSSEALPNAYISLNQSTIKVVSKTTVICIFNIWYNLNSRTESREPIQTIKIEKQNYNGEPLFTFLYDSLKAELSNMGYTYSDSE